MAKDRFLIDTSVLIEPYTKKRRLNYKKRSLALLKEPKSFPFIPVISLSVLGELWLIINEKKSSAIDDRKRDEMLRTLNHFFEQCEKIGLTKDTMALANKISEGDSRLGPVDVLHLASAMSNECKSFLFMDEKIENSEFIKRFIKDEYYSFNLSPFNIKENEDNKRD